MSTDRALHRVDVRLAHTDRSTFLSLVATLHRRGVDVVAAELGTTAEANPGFTVTFISTIDRAVTATASLCNLVDVLEAELVTSAERAGAARKHP